MNPIHQLVALVCCLLSITSISNVQAIIILVHGTFAVSAEWSRPGGEFYENFDYHAKRLNQKLIPFAWSGKLSDAARVQGGRALAKVVLSYPPHEKIIIIGHSHGGNVINLASQILSDPFARLLDLANPAPVDQLLQEAYRVLYGRTQAATTRTIPSLDNLRTNEAVLEFLEAGKEIHEMLKMRVKTKEMSQASSSSHENRQPNLDAEDNQENTRSKDIVGNQEVPYLIDVAYCLATPVDTTAYAPNMDVIGKLYNFYSRGDRIQQLFGTYKRLYSGLTRVVNFRITMEQSGVDHYNPSHSEMHNPIVGTWLLSIPDELHVAGIGNFHQYTDGVNGKIHFDAHGMPNFKPDKKSSNEREEKENNRANRLLAPYFPAGSSQVSSLVA